MIGEKYNMLTVLEKQDIRVNNHIVYLCLCDCGNETVVRGTYIRNGFVKSCGCLNNKLNRLINPRKKREYALNSDERAANDCWNNYKGNARNRGLEFNLSKEDFIELTQSDCVYCGSEPSNKHKADKRDAYYIYNGIDRVDNSIGYVKENCVPCCKRCNMMKGTMSVGEFMEHIKNIHTKMKIPY